MFKEKDKTLHKHTSSKMKIQYDMHIAAGSYGDKCMKITNKINY